VQTIKFDDIITRSESAAADKTSYSATFTKGYHVVGGNQRVMAQGNAKVVAMENARVYAIGHASVPS